MFNKKTKKKYKRLVKGGAGECSAMPKLREHYKSMRESLNILGGGKRRHNRCQKKQKGGGDVMKGPFSVSKALGLQKDLGCEWLTVRGSTIKPQNSKAVNALQAMNSKRLENNGCVGLNGGGRHRKTKKKRRKNNKLIRKKRTRTANKKKRKRKKMGGTLMRKWNSVDECFS